MAKYKFVFRLERPLLLMGIALTAIINLAAPPAAFSQSCALCYTQAASAGARMIQALQSGILILIVPPTFLSVCMIFVMRHKSNQFRQAESETESERPW
jgi:hypothetical protein